MTKLVLATNKLKTDQPYTVYFSDKKKLRSLPQNRYLWGVVYDRLSQAIGYEPEECHEICKTKFSFMTEFNIGHGEVLPVLKSTKMMSTVEMMDFIRKIRQWAMEDFGIHIPEPNEITDEDYVNSKEYN